MTDIDLIPESYRRGRRARSWLGRFAVAYMALLFGLLAAKAVLSVNIDARASEARKMRVDAAAALQRKAHLDQLDSQRVALAKQLAMLDTLRAGPPTGEIFAAVDRALEGRRVRFLSWRFQRAGELVETPARTINTGYFVVVPAGSKKPAVNGWRLRTHMEIKAVAVDHSALAEFVSRLANQAAFKDVKVLETHAQQEGGREVVAFGLAVVIRGR